MQGCLPEVQAVQQHTLEQGLLLIISDTAVCLAHTASCFPSIDLTSLVGAFRAPLQGSSLAAACGVAAVPVAVAAAVAAVASAVTTTTTAATATRASA